MPLSATHRPCLGAISRSEKSNKRAPESGAARNTCVFRRSPVRETTSPARFGRYFTMIARTFHSCSYFHSNVVGAAIETRAQAPNGR